MPANLKRVEFESVPIYRQASSHEPSYKMSLRVWGPANGAGSPSEVAILLHGFLEGIDPDPDMNEKMIRLRYKMMADVLAEKGIASIFLPLPLHFERANGLDFREGQAPVVQQLKKNGAFLYSGGYDQLKRDICLLVQKIKTDPGRFGLSDRPKIHLIGYSLGGAAAMGAAADRTQGLESPGLPVPPLDFESLTVLFSSWGLASIPASAVGHAFERYGFTADNWSKAIAELESQRGGFDEGFRELLWGEGSPDWLSRFPRRVLFIHGLRDEVFPPEMSVQGSLRFFRHFQRMVEDLPAGQVGSLECTFINTYLDHFFLKRWRQVSKYVENFICQGR